MKEAAAPQPTVDETALAQILAFGFSENACRRAVRRLPCPHVHGVACCVCTHDAPLACFLSASGDEQQRGGCWCLAHGSHG